MESGMHVSVSDSDRETISDGSSEEDDFKPENMEVDCGRQVKTTNGDISHNEDSENCPICFESWTSSGPHKLCCLRCGHLFGYSCILKWIRSQAKKARCPQCNSRTVRRDIRVLYTKNLRVLDTSERDRALSDLFVERKARRKAEQELHEYRAKYQLLETEFLQLYDSSKKCLPSNGSATFPASAVKTITAGDTQNSHNSPQYEHLKSITISNNGNCRVLAACDYLNTICVSQPSTNPIFKGFGIRKVNTTEGRPVKYIHLHTQPIRDMAFHSESQDGLLLSASLDKSLRLTSLIMDQVVQTYHCPSPIWSCSWSSAESRQLFAGCANGSVLVFDIRVTSGPLGRLSVPGQTSPVTALQHLPASAQRTSCPVAGLLVGQLTQVTFMAEETVTVSTEPNSPTPASEGDDIPTQNSDRSPDLFGSGAEDGATTSVSETSTHLNSIISATNLPTFSNYLLPLEGSLVSLSLLPSTGHFLASYRPTQRFPQVRHLLAELSTSCPVNNSGRHVAAITTCRDVDTIWGGTRMKLMTRSRVFRGPDRESGMFSVVSNEDVGGVVVWHCDRSKWSSPLQVQTLRPPNASAESPVVDICPFSLGTPPSDSVTGPSHLALLTEHCLHLYRLCSPTCLSIAVQM